MAQDTPSRKLDQYIVRFPDGMRDRLKAAAAQNGRSLNAEIVHRLETSLPAFDADVVVPFDSIASSEQAVQALATAASAINYAQKVLLDSGLLRAAKILSDATAGVEPEEEEEEEERASSTASRSSRSSPRTKQGRASRPKRKRGMDL